MKSFITFAALYAASGALVSAIYINASTTESASPTEDALFWIQTVPNQTGDGDGAAVTAEPSTTDTDLYWIQTVPNPTNEVTAVLETSPSSPVGDGMLWFQRTSSPTSETAQATETVATPLDDSTCDDRPDICPSCNHEEIKSLSGAKYGVECSAELWSTERYEITNDEAVNTTRLCLKACDDFQGCLGVTYSEFGDCFLATGELQGFASSDGGIESVALRRIAAPVSSISSAAMTTTTIRSSSYAMFKPTTVYNRTASTSRSSAVATSAPGACDSSDVSCPACHEQVITDSRNQTYRVFCDNRLYSDEGYAVQRQVTTEGCLLTCDDYTWCDGASFYDDSQCQLARGENVFPVERQGYTAFLPVATVLATPATSPSRYPTINGFTHATSTSSASTFSTAAAGVPEPATTSTCDVLAPTCPECDGVVVTDLADQDYTVKCNTEPFCDRIVEIGIASQLDCMDECDSDPVCFAALWEAGRCDLCDGTMPDLLSSDDYPQAVVMLADHVANETSNEPQGVDAGVDAVTCPAADGTTYQVSPNGRRFGVQCDTGFGAASDRWTSADSFGECAALCTEDCGAIEFVSSTSCGLYTGLSVISSVTGWTAGVLNIMQPRTSVLPSATSSTLVPAAPTVTGEPLFVQPGGPVITAPPQTISATDEQGLSTGAAEPMTSAPPADNPDETQITATINGNTM